jgi:hypothetical protein
MPRRRMTYVRHPERVLKLDPRVIAAMVARDRLRDLSEVDDFDRRDREREHKWLDREWLERRIAIAYRIKVRYRGGPIPDEVLESELEAACQL